MAVLELRPSTMTCTGAGRPRARSRLKVGPTWTTISALRSSTRGAICCWWVMRATSRKLGEPPNPASSSRAASPPSSS